MDCSAAFPAKDASFSSSGAYLAAYTSDRLVLRNALSLKVLHSHKLPHSISGFSFSPNCTLFLVYCIVSEDKAVVRVYSVSSEDVVAEVPVSAQVEGFKHAAYLTENEFAVWSDYNLRVAIYRLNEKKVQLVQTLPFPKQSYLRGWSLRADSRYFALARREDGQDLISIYDPTSNWQLAKQFKSATTDLADISFSANGHYLAVWEFYLDCALYVYALDGRLLCTYVPPSTSGLGIRTVSWSPDSKYLIIGDYSSNIHVLSTLTWTKIYLYSISSTNTACILHRPPSNDWLNLTRGYAIVPFTLDTSSTFASVLSNSNHKIKPVGTAATSTSKAVNLGISTLSFSPTGSHLALREASAPNLVFIYSFHANERKGLQTVIEYEAAVTSMVWRPRPAAEGGEADESCDALVCVYGVKGIGLWFADGSKGGRAEGMGIPSQSMPFST